MNTSLSFSKFISFKLLILIHYRFMYSLKTLLLCLCMYGTCVKEYAWGKLLIKVEAHDDRVVSGLCAIWGILFTSRDRDSSDLLLGGDSKPSYIPHLRNTTWPHLDYRINFLSSDKTCSASTRDS